MRLSTRDAGIILVVFWLLFLHGCEQVQGFLGGANTQQLLGTAKTFISTPGAVYATATPRPAAEGSAKPLPRPPTASGQQIQPQGMPVLPTATAEPLAGQAKVVDLAPPEPTGEGFWTPLELTAMAAEATATAEAFYDTSSLPTPPPEFVTYVNDACAKAEVKSLLCP